MSKIHINGKDVTEKLLEERKGMSYDQHNNHDKKVNIISDVKDDLERAEKDKIKEILKAAKITVADIENAKELLEPESYELFKSLVKEGEESI